MATAGVSRTLSQIPLTNKQVSADISFTGVRQDNNDFFSWFSGCRASSRAAQDAFVKIGDRFGVLFTLFKFRQLLHAHDLPFP